MNRILASSLITALALVAVPATAQTTDVITDACNVGSRNVITIDDGFSEPVATPVGVAGFSMEASDSYQFILDLRGQEVGTKKTVNLTLSWTNGDFADYDMVVNGETYQETAATETASASLGHCGKISLDEYYAYIGTPIDELTLDVSVSAFSF